MGSSICRLFLLQITATQYNEFSTSSNCHQCLRSRLLSAGMGKDASRAQRHHARATSRIQPPYGDLRARLNGVQWRGESAGLTPNDRGYAASTASGCLDHAGIADILPPAAQYGDSLYRRLPHQTSSIRNQPTRRRQSPQPRRSAHPLATPKPEPTPSTHLPKTVMTLRAYAPRQAHRAYISGSRSPQRNHV